MTELLHLSNELLLEIINETQLETLENLTLTCKHIFALGETTLLKHREQKNEHTLVTLNSFYNNFDRTPYTCGEYPAIVLWEVLGDRSVAAYARKLRIGYSEEEDHLGNKDDVIMVECHDTMRQALMECSYISMEDFQEEIQSGSVDATIALLVTLLPNLETIEIQNLSKIANRFSSMITSIVEATYYDIQDAQVEDDWETGALNSSQVISLDLTRRARHALRTLRISFL